MNTQTVNKSVKPGRRWDIDWLRVLVLLLVPFHTVRIFDFDPFYVKNDQLVTGLSYWFVRVGDAFAMELLFLLSGAATWFALRRRSGGQYAKERFKRLLIPFIFGVLVLAPPNAYFALRTHSNYAGSFPQFYPHFFEVGPLGPFFDFTGGFTTAHLWFILLLFIFSLVALPLFLYLKRASGRRLIEGLAGFFTRPGMIFLLAIPLIVVEWLLDFYPNLLLFLAFFFTFFIYGYILIADARFGETIVRHKKLALILGPALYIVLGAIPDTIKPDWLGLLYYRSFFPWFTIVAVLGYGKRYLSFSDGRSLSDKFLVYFGEGSYPFYLLHLPVLVTIGYYVAQWDASVRVKCVTIAVATFVTTTILYEVLVRRINLIRFLFGMRPKRKLEL